MARRSNTVPTDANAASSNCYLSGLRIAVDTAGACFLVLVLVSVIYEVVTRYFFNDAATWTDPAAGVALAWLVFLGAASAVWTGTNLGTDYLRTHIPSAIARTALAYFELLATIAFGLTMAWSGLLLANANRSATVQGLGLSFTVVYSVTVIAGGLIAIFALSRLLKLAIGGLRRADRR